jgi:hypothetical protein
MSKKLPQIFQLCALGQRLNVTQFSQVVVGQRERLQVGHLFSDVLLNVPEGNESITRRTLYNLLYTVIVQEQGFETLHQRQIVNLANVVVGQIDDIELILKHKSNYAHFL